MDMMKENEETDFTLSRHKLVDPILVMVVAHEQLWPTKASHAHHMSNLMLMTYTRTCHRIHQRNEMVLCYTSVTQSYRRLR